MTQAPVVVVYANAAPSGEVPSDAVPSDVAGVHVAGGVRGSALMADHLRHAVPLARRVERDRRERERERGGSCPETAPGQPPTSPGGFSGKHSAGQDRAAGGQRAHVLRRFRDQAPARWRAFLHAHFSGPGEVSFFFDVDEKSGRNWWNGVGRPTVDRALYAEMAYPEGYRAHMLGGAAQVAAE